MNAAALLAQYQSQLVTRTPIARKRGKKMPQPTVAQMGYIRLRERPENGTYFAHDWTIRFTARDLKRAA